MHSTYGLEYLVFVFILFPVHADYATLRLVACWKKKGKTERLPGWLGSPVISEEEGGLEGEGKKCGSTYIHCRPNSLTNCVITEGGLPFRGRYAQLVSTRGRHVALGWPVH